MRVGSLLLLRRRRRTLLSPRTKCSLALASPCRAATARVDKVEPRDAKKWESTKKKAFGIFSFTSTPSLYLSSAFEAICVVGKRRSASAIRSGDSHTEVINWSRERELRVLSHCSTTTSVSDLVLTTACWPRFDLWMHCNCSLQLKEPKMKFFIDNLPVRFVYRSRHRCSKHLRLYFLMIVSTLVGKATWRWRVSLTEK
jgi:hypothetical protein